MTTEQPAEVESASKNEETGSLRRVVSRHTTHHDAACRVIQKRTTCPNMLPRVILLAMAQSHTGPQQITPTNMKTEAPLLPLNNVLQNQDFPGAVLSHHNTIKGPVVLNHNNVANPAATSRCLTKIKGGITRCGVVCHWGNNGSWNDIHPWGNNRRSSNVKKKCLKLLVTHGIHQN
ncbi:hypothetical protein ACFE04_021158 [Oxalis oulophora]